MQCDRELALPNAVQEQPLLGVRVDARVGAVIAAIVVVLILLAAGRVMPPLGLGCGRSDNRIGSDLP